MCGCQGHEASTKIMFQKWWASIGNLKDMHIYIHLCIHIYIHVVLSLLLCFTKIFMGLQWLTKSYWKYQMWQRWSFWVVSAAFFCLVSAHRLSCGHQKWLILQHPFTFLWNHAMDFCTSKHWSNRRNTGKSPAVYGWDVGHKLPTETHGRPNGSGTWCH